MKYQIIKEHTIERLVEIVNEFLDLGWEVSGSMGCTVTLPYQFYQTMIKR